MKLGNKVDVNKIVRFNFDNFFYEIYVFGKIFCDNPVNTKFEHFMNISLFWFTMLDLENKK